MASLVVQLLNQGFVTFKTIAEAHRIARAHQGPLKELHGARLNLAPMPQDIVWQNISREPAELRSRRIFGFVIIGVICFFYTVPVSGAFLSRAKLNLAPYRFPSCQLDCLDPLRALPREMEGRRRMGKLDCKSFIQANVDGSFLLCPVSCPLSFPSSLDTSFPLSCVESVDIKALPLDLDSIGPKLRDITRLWSFPT